VTHFSSPLKIKAGNDHRQAIEPLNGQKFHPLLNETSFKIDLFHIGKELISYLRTFLSSRVKQQNAQTLKN
jgi:hypothetical protein